MPAKQLPVSRTGKPNPIDIHVGSRVRLRRNFLGLSQTKLGEAVGLTFQQIQKYERGVDRISVGRLVHMAQVLEVPITFFFEDLDDFSLPENTRMPGSSKRGAKPDAMLEDPLSKRETLELVRAYYQIEDAVLRKQFYSLIRSIAHREN